MTPKLPTPLIIIAMVTWAAISLPAYAQGSTQTQTTTQLQAPMSDAEWERQHGRPPGPGENLPTGGDTTPQPYTDEQKPAFEGKDAWDWFWNHKAHIGTTKAFWSDDFVGNFFKNISDGLVIPVWNTLMEYDIARAFVLLVLAGIPIGIGIRISGGLNRPAKDASK